MLNLEPQELYFLRTAIEASNIKGTDVRFVAQVLGKLDEEFKTLVEQDKESVPPEVLESLNPKPAMSMTPPAGRAPEPSKSKTKVKKLDSKKPITD